MAHNKKTKLPDTPWHVGYTLKDENDPRRHKARCIHFNGEICKCDLSGCFMTNCMGSAHCKHYAEGQAQWLDYLEEMKTEEQKNEEQSEIRATIYRKKKIDFMQTQLQSGTYHERFQLRPAMIRCPFCHERLKELECEFCLAKFKVVEEVTEDTIKTESEKGYFLILKK